MSASPDLPSPARTLLLTLVAVVAFAANSVLCRLALGEGLIDAASFATVRVMAGALILVVLMTPRWRAHGRRPADWVTASMLFTYMVFFSFAYLSLGVAAGALVLFPTVQLTMFISALRSGERFPALSWAGLSLAVIGLVYLVSPGLSAPDPLGAALMAVAGVAWGIYSLRGAGGSDPLEATANNFLCSVPLVLGVSLLFAGQMHVTAAGVFWAVISGAVASGLGYVVWYAALKGLTASRAATVQLSVPVIAAFGGVVLLSEPVTLRLLLASAAILGGVAMVLGQRARVSSV
jgi:drug/metabolite transporter (DMT)-like permease